MTAKISDCLVIGGGPAGLTAAIYLARFHLSVRVIDGGRSRMGMIPLTRNHAGFPEGISGRALLERMQRQAIAYGAELREGTVDALERTPEGFIARIGREEMRASAVLLATGVVNRRPSMMTDGTHDRALADGRLRYCPICDGYEITDRNVAVLGSGSRGYDEAVFLRSYTPDVTLVAPDIHELSDEQLTALDDAGIALAQQCRDIRLSGDKIVLELEGGPQAFDSLYPALGSDIHSELAEQVGVRMADTGCITVDSHQRTNVPCLYAAGDVVLGLDQISHAMGGGGVAATTIRNDLARHTPLRR